MMKFSEATVLYGIESRRPNAVYTCEQNGKF